MRMSLRKPFRWFAYLVVASVAMYLITNFVLNTDKAKPVIEKFLESSEEVISQVGNIKKIKLIKRVSISATETSSPYRLYTFIVDGDKAKATIVVRAEQTSQGDTQKQFLITTIKLD